VLHAIKSLNHFHLIASDGEIGKVQDSFFDDSHWTVRYLIVRTGSWLTGRNVLISPISVRNIDWDQKQIHVSLTREEVKNSPDIDTDKPVSRQMEEQYFDYYRWPYYWTGTGIWGIGPYPSAIGREEAMGVPYRVDENSWLPGHDPLPTSEVIPLPPEVEGDPRLRSVHEVVGYRIAAVDSEFGHVEDLVFDDENWKIRYLVIDTKNWWPSKSVLVSPDWVTTISWRDQSFRIHLESEIIQASPEYKPDEPIQREYEQQLYDYYGKQEYWGEDGSRLTTLHHAAKKPGRHVI
jgi:sporulation protein YlmC with PRC-barrel domain